MEKKIELKDGRILVMNGDWLTVKARKEIAKRFPEKTLVLTDDKETLQKLEKQFKETPPSQMQIYEAFLLLHKEPEDDREELIFEQVCRACCKWETGKGKTKAQTAVTEEEYENLPFTTAEYIAANLFSESEKSFLVVAPE